MKKKTKKAGKKKAAKKAVKKSSRKVKKIKKVAVKKEKPVGRVTHFYGNIKVAVIKFGKALPVGVSVSFRGATTEFSQNLSSVQFNHESLKRVPKGKSVGVKVAKKVRENDLVYLEK